MFDLHCKFNDDGFAFWGHVNTFTRSRNISWNSTNDAITDQIVFVRSNSTFFGTISHAHIPFLLSTHSPSTLFNLYFTLFYCAKNVRQPSLIHFISHVSLLIIMHQTLDCDYTVFVCISNGKRKIYSFIFCDSILTCAPGREYRIGLNLFRKCSTSQIKRRNVANNEFKLKYLKFQNENEENQSNQTVVHATNNHFTGFCIWPWILLVFCCALSGNLLSVLLNHFCWVFYACFSHITILPTICYVPVLVWP